MSEEYWGMQVMKILNKMDIAHLRDYSAKQFTKGLRFAIRRKIPLIQFVKHFR